MMMVCFTVSRNAASFVRVNGFPGSVRIASRLSVSSFANLEFRKRIYYLTALV